MLISKQDQLIRSLFNKQADTYGKAYDDDHSPHGYFFRQRLKKIFALLDNFHGINILDLGCGPGMMVDYCVSREFNFFGVDISENMIRECNKKFGHINSTHFSVGKIQKLEFPDSFFDVVLCMGAMEYIDEREIDCSVSEIARVLKPGGLFIVSLLNKRGIYWGNNILTKCLNLSESIKVFIKRLLGRKSEFKPLLVMPPFIRLFEENDFHSLLIHHQFSIIDTQYFALNVLSDEFAHRYPRLCVLLSKALKQAFKGSCKWPYMAFIVVASIEEPRS